MNNSKKYSDIDFTVYFQTSWGVNYQTEEMSLPSDDSITSFCKSMVYAFGEDKISWMYWTNGSKIKTFICGSKLYFQECEFNGVPDLCDFDSSQEDLNNG